MAAENTTAFTSRTQAYPNAQLALDNTALFGVDGQVRNIDGAINKSLALVATSGTAATIAAAAFPCGTLDVQPGASGGFTLTLPSTASIINNYPPTIPQNGAYNVEIDILNDAVGQTATLTAGDASTTILGTATIASGYCRKYLVNINVLAGTMTWINKGVTTL